MSRKGCQRAPQLQVSCSRSSHFVHRFGAYAEVRSSLCHNGPRGNGFPHVSRREKSNYSGKPPDRRTTDLSNKTDVGDDVTEESVMKDY
jgi:hypothetical protein